MESAATPLQGALFYGDSSRPVPAYETDIAAAWDVVEKMREMGLDVFLRFMDALNTERAKWYEANLSGYTELTDDEQLELALEGTLMWLLWRVRDVPALICRAALAAVEASNE